VQIQRRGGGGFFDDVTKKNLEKRREKKIRLQAPGGEPGGNKKKKKGGKETQGEVESKSLNYAGSIEKKNITERDRGSKPDKPTDEKKVAGSSFEEGRKKRENGRVGLSQSSHTERNVRKNKKKEKRVNTKNDVLIERMGRISLSGRRPKERNARQIKT